MFIPSGSVFLEFITLIIERRISYVQHQAVATEVDFVLRGGDL